MQTTAHDLKLFYNTKTGRVVRRLLQKRINEIWPDVTGQEVIGLGYALPYLKTFRKNAARLCAVMEAECGVHHWPSDQTSQNAAVLCDTSAIPLATESVDHILVMHHIEYIEQLKINLRECWRVLRPGGKMLVIVPNRMGFWSRADWSPFGHGQPFSLSQIIYYLKDSGFAVEQTAEALFVPPSRNGLILRSANMFEEIGRRIMPMLSGVHMVEVTKQVYAVPRVGEKKKRMRSAPLLAEPTS